MDTEGHDLEVLRSGVELFESRLVDFVYVECGFGNRPTFHRPLSEFIEFFARFEYLLYGVYEQGDGYIDREVWYANALFFRKDWNMRPS